MSFFKDLSKKISETAKEAAKKSSNFMELTKVSVQMDKYQDEIGTHFYEMGKSLYENYSEDSWVKEKYGTRIEEIKSLQQQMKELNEEVSKLKNITVCETCKEEISTELKFCPNCGARIADIEVDNQVKTKVDDVVCFKKCKVCSSENSPDAKACSKCGTIF